jgi:hypothetical protein
MKVLALLVLVGAFITACASPTTQAPEMIDSAALEKACVDAGGKYLDPFNECENVSAASCKAMGGSFDECASGCRHLPESVMCTAQCVPVCSFGAADASRQPESVIAQLNNPLECNLLAEPRTIDAVVATYGCQAPGAYLTFVDTRSDPWTAGYFTTDSQSTKVTYGPERITVLPKE